ncbi:MAG: helix-turn-helix domain-containing protein [Alphaproteobacteria bacterium]
MKRVPLKRLREKWMADPAFRTEYERLAPEFEMAQALVKARLRAGLSQSQVARKMGTTQSAVARLESGTRSPTTRTLELYAKATNSRLKVTLVPAE